MKRRCGNDRKGSRPPHEKLKELKKNEKTEEGKAESRKACRAEKQQVPPNHLDTMK